MQNYIGDKLGIGFELEDTYVPLDSFYVDIRQMMALKPWSRPTFPWQLACEPNGGRLAAFENYYMPQFNSMGVIEGLDIQPITASLIVINSILVFLMLAYFNDSQGSTVVKAFCTPTRPVVIAMFLQRIVVLVAFPMTLDKLMKMQ